MTKTFRPKTVVARPGELLYRSLKLIAQSARRLDIGFGEWGVCECDNRYWIGPESTHDGQGVLRVSLLDAFEARDRQYDEWGDEEVLLFFGRDEKSREFRWFLLSNLDFKKKEEELAALRIYS